MKRRFLYIFILIFVSILIIFPFLFAHRQFQRKKISKASLPNVLFIVLDAARADHFSCYGYNRNTTPYIDAISREGVIFLNNFSQATRTLDSLPKIFFSRYFSIPTFQLDTWLLGSKHERPYTNFKKFDDQQISLTKVLSLNGYRTVLFSELSLNKKDYFVQDFDESYLVPYIFPLNIISSLISWVEKNKEEKFFICCHIMSPHEPYSPKDDEKEFFTDAENDDVERARKKITRCIDKRDDSTAGWNQNELYILNGLYDSKLKQADKWVGSIYDKLKELNLEKNTLIIISSDHGKNLGEHNLFGHGSPTWDSVIKVPLIIVYPPLIPPGIKVRGLTESVDIMPTITDACGIKLPRGKSMDGVSLLKFIRNPDSAKKAVFATNSIRTKKYKYISDPESGSFLYVYDLDKDPGEEKNIASDKPLIRKKLQNRLERSMKPYSNRYEATKRINPPYFPFYFTISCFKITSMDIIERREYYIENTTSFLNETSLQEPCLFNLKNPEKNFFFIPKGGLSYPTTFSTNLPSGTYRIFVLLESLSEVSFFPQQLGFQFRFNPQNSFNFPYKIDLIRRSTGTSYCYLDLGETQVNEDNFSVEVKFQPLDNKPYIIHHIKFVPKGCQEEKQTEEFNEEELRRRIENLKSLGYL